MTLSLIKNPSATRFGIKSRAVAAVGQVAYEFIKTDDTFAQYTETASKNLALQTLGQSDYNNGELVGFRSNDGELIGFGEIISDAAPTQIAIDFFYDQGTKFVGGTIFRPDKYTNYVVEINVRDSGDNVINESPLTFTLDPTGRLFVDLKTIIQQLIVRDRTVFGRIYKEFSIEWRERYEGTTPAFTGDEIIQGVGAWRQIGSYAGGNLWDAIVKQTVNVDGEVTNVIDSPTTPGRLRLSVPDPAAYAVGDVVYLRTDDGAYNFRQEVLEVDATWIETTGPYVSDATTGRIYPWGGRILSAFSTFKPQQFQANVSPKYWDGWAQSVSVIVDPDLDAREATSIVWYFRINSVNKTGLGSLQTNGIQQTPTRIETRQIPALKDIGGPVAGQYYVLIYIRTSGADNRAERLYFRIEPECERPIMVEWLNDLGGWDTWLFSYNQELEERPEIETRWETPQDVDYEDNQGGDRKQTPEVRETITLTAEHLSRDQVDALKSIQYSPEIYIYLRKDGSKKVRATVRDSWTLQRDTKTRDNTMNLVLRMPVNFELLSGLEYEF